MAEPVNDIPQDCSDDIYKNGEYLGIIINYPSPHIEAFVRYAAQLSGQRIDWHYAGGRAVILYIGDRDKVIDGFRQLRLDPKNHDLPL